MNRLNLNLVSIIITCVLSSGLFSADLSTDKVVVGDYLRTRQCMFGDHVAVVVKTCTKDHAHRLSGGDCNFILAENSMGGVKFVSPQEFIINGIGRSDVVRDAEKNKPYIIVARAVAALATRIEYDIATKSCGLFADWCLMGPSSGVRDFRKADSSLTRQTRQILQLCDGSDTNKQILVAIATAFDQGFGDVINDVTLEQLASFGKNPEQFAEFIRNIYRTKGIRLETRGTYSTEGVSAIISEAFALDRDHLGLTDSALATLAKMSDQEAMAFCSRIVDADIAGINVDINRLLEPVAQPEGPLKRERASEPDHLAEGTKRACADAGTK